MEKIEYIDSHSGVPSLKHWQIDVLKKLIKLNNQLDICLEIDTLYDVEEAETFLKSLKGVLYEIIKRGDSAMG